MKNQAFNPYLPSWEYVPDGEPHVFGGRVYIYGSHDRFNGCVFCMNDYVCWSAPENDLADWRYEGVIYKKTDDPMNADGRMCLYAPDVTRGADGRYYLYYVLDKRAVVSVAVCDTPAGKYEFYGYVHYEDGTRLGERAGDEPQFDPAVLTEGSLTYLYTGFCMPEDRSRSGPMATVLGEDMLTVKKAPVFIMPSKPYGGGSGFEGHEFFEAASIRRVGELYFFVYSSVAQHELCYALCDSPAGKFTYGGVIVSSCDKHIDSYKPAAMEVGFAANNHGGIVNAAGQWYIFYHRHTNGSWFCRQGCAERIEIAADGSVAQVEMTSCGLNPTPLRGEGTYPAYIACNLFNVKNSSAGFVQLDCPAAPTAKISQECRDGEEETGYIDAFVDGSVAGFKYFDCKGITRVSVTTMGYIHGEIRVKTSIDGDPLGSIPVDSSNVPEEHSADIVIPDGVNALYFEHCGSGGGRFLSFALKKSE